MTDDSTPPLYESPRSKHVRLLPRDGSGKRSYLRTDSHRSTVGRLADALERSQMSAAEDMLARGRTLLNEPAADAGELRAALSCLLEHLDDVLVISESRGERLRHLLPDVIEDDEEEEEWEDEEDQGDEETPE
ncbi:hypothetical protein ABZX85_36060 [Streptomyces sp. NPDC004539]|uniref:hypothetical protein n=1 Tax=Streptomyces sp. NPDC004539 TaxID=3154280 RepID=UPI0033B6FB6B